MKKKVSLLLCILMTALCFTGCSGQAEKAKPDTQTMEQIAEAMISTFSEMTEEFSQQFRSMSEDQLNYVMWSNGFPIKGEDFLAMISSWEAAENECGEYVSHGDFVAEVKTDGVVLSTEAQYKDREATISFSFDEASSLESMDVSAKYATGEILKKAGLNTLLGMGTVFAVLIFLAFLISLMKYIPALLDMMTGKGEKQAGEAVSVAIAPVVTSTTTAPVATVAEVVDDLELVAVITAAIAAQEGTTTDGFVVRSIRRRPSNNWN